MIIESSTEQRVTVIDPSGQTGNVPASQLDAAQKAGYRAVTDPAELKQLQDKEEYSSGILHPAQAALMGVARGLTFGGSDELLNRTGLVDQDTSKNLMEYQPVASGGGKIVGQILPMLIPGVGEAAAGAELAEGGAAAAELAEAGVAAAKGGAFAAEGGTAANAANMANLAKQAGGAAKAAAPALVPNAAEAGAVDYGEFLGSAAKIAVTPVRAVTSVGEAVQKVMTGSLNPGWLGKLQGAAARGAVEGAIYNVGDDVTEDAIGNKPLAAESLLATAGMGALLGAPMGAGFEGALGLAQKIAPNTMERVSNYLQKVEKKWKGGVPDSAAEIKDFTATQQKANDGMRAAEQEFKDSAKKEYAEAVLGGQNRTGDVVNNLTNDIDVQYGTRKIGDANAEMAEALRAARSAEKSQEEFFKEYHETDKYVHVDKLVGGTPVNPDVTANLERAIGNLAESQFGSTTLERFKEVIGQHLSNLKAYGETSEVLKDAQRELAALREVELGDKHRAWPKDPNITIRHLNTERGPIVFALHAGADTVGERKGWIGDYAQLKNLGPDIFKAVVGAAEFHGNEVNAVDVAHNFRRRGIATALYDYAEQHLNLRPEPNSTQTEAGRLFWLDRAAGQPRRSTGLSDAKTGPEQAHAGLTSEEIAQAANEGGAQWNLKRAGLPTSIKLSPEVLAQDRGEFVKNYIQERAAKKLTDTTEANVQAAEKYAAYAAELARHIQETQAHLAELPNTKNLADQFKSMDQLKKKLDKIKEPFNGTPRDQLMFGKVVAARGEIKTALEDEGLFGPAAKYQKEINEKMSRHYASLGKPNSPGFAKDFTSAAGSAAEREEGRRLISSKKLTNFIKDLAKGGVGVADVAGHWASHILDTSEAAERVAKLTFGDNPKRFQDAENLVAKLKMANSKVRGAAEKLAAVKEAASAPRAASASQSRAVARWGNKLESLLKGTTDDAGRFGALSDVYHRMERAKLTPAEVDLRKTIGNMLQDTTLFGKAAEMHVASESVFAQAKLARNALERQFFREPVGVGESTPQMKTKSVEAHINQFARGRAGSADSVKVVDDYVKASKDALNYIHREVYPKLSTPRTQRSTEAFLNKVQDQRAKAAAAKKYDIANPPDHGMLKSVGHGGALAVGLHAMGIHAALPAFVLYRVLRNPTQTLHVVGTAAGHAANLVKRLGELSQGVFERAAGKGASLVGPTVSNVLENVSFGPKSPDKETRAQATKRTIQDIAKLAQPEEFQKRMDSALGTLQARAPETAELVMNRGQRAVQYLLNNAPSAASPDSGLPGQRSWIPSDKDIFEYSQRVRAVADPTVLLQDMRAGKLTASAVEAVQAVYPEIFQATVAGVQAQLAQQKAPLSAVQLQQLSTLFGKPTGAVQMMLPALQQGATSPLPDQPSLDNGTQPQKKLPGTFTKLGESERAGTNLSSTQNKE